MHTDTKINHDNLPAPLDDEDFHAGDRSDRLIQGTILRFVDNRWHDREGTAFALGTPMLAIGTTQAVQRWQDGLPIETIIDRPLPDVAELNAAIPENEWEIGLGGAPRPPWVLQYIVYLIDPRDGAAYTYINSTTGAEISVDRLTSRVRHMRTLRNAKVVPLISLDSRPMQTRYGEKMRPEFSIIEWRDLGGGSVKTEPAPQASAPPEATQATTPSQPRATKRGKPIKPATLGVKYIDLDDEIAF